MAKTIKLPHSWGEDSLSEFQAISFNNELATFDTLSEYTKLITNIDVILSSCAEHSLRMSFDDEANMGMLLFINAHNHFRATVRLATAGQCICAYPTGRAAIESALYGWYLSVDAEAKEQWHKKPDPTDREAIKNWSNKFKFSNITNHLAANDKPTSERLKHLHQLAIDFGAHPNETALYSNFKRYQNSANNTIFALTYLHPNGLLFSHTFKFLVEVGLVTLELINHASKEMSEALELKRYIKELLQQFAELQPQIEANSEIEDTIKEGDKVNLVNRK